MREHLEDFVQLTQEPVWHEALRWTQQADAWKRTSATDNFDEADAEELRENRRRAVSQRAKLLAWLEGMIDELASSQESSQQPLGGNSIFVVHGHDDGLKEKVARFLEQRGGLDVVILHEQTTMGRTIIEKLEDHSSVGFAVILLTADDVGRSRLAPDLDLEKRGRQNVVFEWGYFLALLGRQKVCALIEPGVQQPSDLSGVLAIPLDAGEGWKLSLLDEIAAAGIRVKQDRA
jgi:predicted nucleotide-binding protein